MKYDVYLALTDDKWIGKGNIEAKNAEEAMDTFLVSILHLVKHNEMGWVRVYPSSSGSYFSNL